MNRFAIALLTSLTACYGAAPPHPVTIPLPPRSGSELIDVESESTTKIENVAHHSSTCPQGHTEGDPACVVTTYTVAEPVTRTTTTATLDGKPLTIAQFRVITDAEYDHKLERLADLSHKCQRANVPRWLGMGLAIGGLVALGAAGKLGKVSAYVGEAALAGGGVSYGFGYFAYGGRDCNEANGLYRQIDYSGEMTDDSIGGTEAAREMAELASKFNQRNVPTRNRNRTSMRFR